MKVNNVYGLKPFFERLLAMFFALLVQSGMAYQLELLAHIESGDAEKLKTLIINKGVSLEEQIDLNLLAHLYLKKKPQGSSISKADFDLITRMQEKVKLIRFGNPLTLAAAYGHSDLVQMLLELGSDPEGGADVSFPPLFSAASKGHLDIVKQLIEAGANPLRCSDHDTPLHIAARGGHTNVARELLSLNPESINSSCSDKPEVRTTPLMSVLLNLYNDKSGIYSLLLDPERSADLSGWRGRQALQMALEYSVFEDYDPTIDQMILEHPQFDHSLLQDPALMELINHPPVEKSAMYPRK